ncbi:SPFH domain-containing protein [Yinghuangia sp. YIM S10712]|uniref:SPFH domain-containing protein n=1 Tax=Yinghuangia sp. YIM S10712 TaxID=3436930 RepID=UPI003F52FE7F
MTVIEHATPQPPADAGAVDGRVLDTAEVRVLNASGLAPAPVAAAWPELPHPQQLARFPDRGKDTVQTTGGTAVTATGIPPAPYAMHPAGGPAHTRFPRADQEMCEHTAPSLAGWVVVPAVLVSLCAVAWAVIATGTVNDRLPGRVRGNPMLDIPQPLAIGIGVFGAVLGLLLILGMFVVEAGTARVLSRFGRYQGTVRRTGLVWAPPLSRRHSLDVGIRHWRSRPMQVTDRQGTPLQVMVLVVWQVRDTARARFAVRDCEQYLRQQIEAAVSGVVATLPCDSFTHGSASLRDTEHVNDEMTRRLSGAMAAAGIRVFTAQVLHMDYAPQIADSMLRRRIASLDATTRTAVLDDVVDTVSQAVEQFSRRALVRLDDDSRTSFIRDLTVAMYASRTAPQPPMLP